MKKSKDRLKVLIDGYFDQSIKPEELSELSDYVLDEDYQTDLEQMFPNAFDSDIHFTDEGLEQKLKQNILSHIFNYSTTETKQLKQRRLRFYMASAAAVLILLSPIIWLYTSRNLEGSATTTDRFNYANDVAPGKNTATLTLPNGSIVQLSDTKSGVVVASDSMKYNDNTSVIPSEHSDEESLGHANSRDLSVLRDDGKQILTATTPRGGTYEFTLPDGTKVWLNALSSIKFPLNLAKLKNRKVELIGEAYFEVTKKVNKTPFMVLSKGQEVEVLGTHFNVNAYADENSTKTTLLEGSVRVTPLENQKILNRKSNIVTLAPNQQATLTSSNRILITNVDGTAAISWQTGYFTFNRERLDEIMRKVSRWYDVNVIYKDESIKSIPFSGTITRFSQVSDLLNMLKLTGEVTFEIAGRKIIIDKK